jgi:enolase
MFTIDHLAAWQILDSRGRPTVAARATLHGSSVGITQVRLAPQPASTRPSSDATAIPCDMGAWA